MIWELPPKILFEPTLDNYILLLESYPEFLSTLGNSAIITSVTVLLTLSVATVTGYALSRFKFRFDAQFAFFTVIVRFVPPIIIIPSMYIIVRSFGLYDTHFILIVFYTAFNVSLSTMMAKVFIDEVPIELEESAMVDGATRYYTFFKVTLPVASPGLAATAVFIAISAWNEYLFASMFTSKFAKTVPMIVGEITGSVVGPAWGPLTAAGTILMMPVLIFSWAVQKYLIKGLTFGAVKG